MNVELTGTKLTLDLRDVFENIHGAEALMEIAQNLACTDEVIAAVAQQIVHRCTDEGWHGPTSGYVDERASGLDAAIRMVIMARDDICRREHAALEQRLAQEQVRTAAAWAEVQKLQDAADRNRRLG